MNLLVRFDEVLPPEICESREAYINGLQCPQELLIEVLVDSAQCYRIIARGRPCGHLIIHGGDTAIELHLDRNYWVFGEVIFAQAIRKLSLQKALVKSFDHLFFSAAIDHQVKVHSRGLLVRDFVPRELPHHDQIVYSGRKAQHTDIDRIMKVKQDVFSVPERIARVVISGFVEIFEDPDGATIGFGIIRPVIVGRSDVDLGIAVDARFRNKGYAIYMMRDLVQAALARGLRPICGCAADNPASRRMGERVGLVARHRLLEITFDSSLLRR
jgi:GNAT superfamily N-acetyltransferase